MRAQKSILTYLFMFLLVLTMQSCTSLSDSVSQASPVPTVVGVNRPPEGKFFFVQMRIDYGGVGILFDRPLYDFDPNTKTIKALYRADLFPLQDWGLLGNILSSSFKIGAESGSGAAGLKAVNSLPHEDTTAVFTGRVKGPGNPEMNEIPVKLLAISAEGTLSLEIDGQHFILEVDETWEYSDQADFVKDSIEHHYQITTSITNYGWLDRSQIQFRP